MSAITKRYVEQHQDLLEVAGRLQGMLDAAALADEAQPVRSVLSELLGKLSVHLAMEDEVLYPRLLEHEDKKVRDIATRVQAEMGGIAKAVGQYRETWPSARAIQQKPEDFVEQTTGILSALAARIQLEDEQLFPCLQKLA